MIDNLIYKVSDLSVSAQDIGIPKVELDSGIVAIINTLLFIAGAAAVGFIIFGGIRYIVSQGNSQAVEDAKNTILYAVIGLIISIFAYALVSFIIKKV